MLEEVWQKGERRVRAFHGVLAVLRITAPRSLQPGLASGLTELPTPMLTEMLLTCLMPDGSTVMVSMVPAAWSAATS